jgi:hypothetical protein
VKQFATVAIEGHLKPSEPSPSCCPAFFQQVAVVPWQSLDAGMQGCISQLCEAVGKDQITQSYIPRYLELMASPEAADQSPVVPELGAISYGALVALCEVMKVPPPKFIAKAELQSARERLVKLSGQAQFDLTKQLCALAQADLAWLRFQPVLGAGSVVLHGSSVRLPKVILRPRVSHDFNGATKKLVREVCYTTVDGTFLKATAIFTTLAKSTWPLNRVPAVNFEWQGPEKPFYTPFVDMRPQAEEWGITGEAASSHAKLQPLFVAAAAREYLRQFKAAVDTAWQDAQHAADKGPSEQQQLSGKESAL